MSFYPMLQKNNLKIAAYLSFAVFIVMLVDAVFYYKERMLFADASHIAFQAINEQKLQIQQYRFGSFITQIVPVIAAKIGLPIRWILMAYSASFNVFYLFVAAVLLFGFKSYRFLILYAFYWVLVTTHSFFWPNNEVHQGVAYMFLLLPALINCGEKQRPFALPVVLLTVLGATALFCHPLVLPPFIFLWVYLILEKEHWHYSKKQTIVLSAIAAIIIAAKVYVSKKYAGYDSNLLKGVSDMHANDVLKVFSSPFAKEIYRHVSMNYWILPIISLLGIITLLLKRKFLLAIWTAGCALVYFILVCITYAGYMEFISESELMAGIIIATCPFAFLTLTLFKEEIGMVVLLLIFMSRYSKVVESRSQFISRVDALSQMLAKMKSRGITKAVLVKKEPYTEWRWMVEWGFATETALLSAMIWDKPIRQFVVLNPGDLEKRVPKDNKGVMTCYDIWPIGKLNRRYFPFDTTSSYQVLSYEEFIK
ncbi:MAG: hypothetical protein JSS82_00555 [Bacteroidetes bacterium]|nr:hypothetical protein [Bacteroidota bacterium]